jgi:hypothetical protein
MYDIASMKKIEIFINKELNVNLLDAAIFKHDDVTYELFNKYIIKKISEYKFLVTTSYEQKSFSFLKNAVIWCTFKKRDKFYEMKRIEELDILMNSIDVMIEQHTKLSISANAYEDKLIYLAKLNEDKLKKQYMLKEIKDYVSDSKAWQLKKFQTTLKSINK